MQAFFQDGFGLLVEELTGFKKSRFVLY